jgi:hypothetical protein
MCNVVCKFLGQYRVKPQAHYGCKRFFMEGPVKVKLAILVAVFLSAWRVSVECLITHPGTIGEKALYLAMRVLFPSPLAAACDTEIAEPVPR